MQLREIMTAGVVTAGADADLLSVAQLMRDHSVGSVVICDSEGEPAAMVTDRDLTVRALAEERSPGEPVGEHASRPAGHRRARDGPRGGGGADGPAPASGGCRCVDGGDLVGIVTLDDIAVRTGNLEVAQRMTQEVIEGALPGFFFHERG